MACESVDDIASMMGKPAITFKHARRGSHLAGGLSPEAPAHPGGRHEVHEMFFRISAQVNSVTRNRLMVVREAMSRSDTNMFPISVFLVP